MSKLRGSAKLSQESMRSRNNSIRRILGKFEPQLASIWSVWLSLNRKIVKIRWSSPKQSRNDSTNARLFREAGRFWATNDEVYLRRATRLYFRQRDEWLKFTPTPRNDDLVVTGWANTKDFGKLQRAFPDVQVKRVFRPDVWYLTSGSASFFSGFRFKAPKKLLLENHSDLQQSAQLIDAMNEIQKDSQFSRVPLKYESISPAASETGFDWLGAFETSPRLFTWLVEATVDRELASKMVDYFVKLQMNTLSEEWLRCVAIALLVSQRTDQANLPGGWALTRIATPIWNRTSLDSSAPKSARDLEAKFVEGVELSVTNGGIVLTDGQFLDWDKAQNPALDFIAGNHPFVLGSSANLEFCYVKVPPVTIRIPSGIILSSRVDSNWFHFLIETLPRLLFVEGAVDPSMPVLVSSRIPETAREALRLVTKRPIIELDPTTTTRVTNAVLPGPVIYHPDTQFLWNSTAVEAVNVEVLLELRRRILAEVRPVPGNQRIYWSRPGTNRSLLNGSRVSRILKRKGYAEQDPAEMSFAQQVQSIHGSSSLVAVGGALMANFLFAAPKTKILVLVSDFGLKYKMPSTISKLAEANLEMIGGRSVGLGLTQNIVQKAHSSFQTRTRRLVRSINLALKE